MCTLKHDRQSQLSLHYVYSKTGQPKSAKFKLCVLLKACIESLNTLVNFMFITYPNVGQSVIK